MCKNILIHTDFTIRSLGLLKTALSEHPDQKVNIILSHGVRLSSSISELMFFSKHKLIQSLISGEFENALQVIQNKYASQINHLKIEVFSGSNQLAFQNFIEGNKIQEAYVYMNYPTRLSNANCFDISSMILKLDAVHQIPFEENAVGVNHQETFADLFFSRIPGFNR